MYKSSNTAWERETIALFLSLFSCSSTLGSYWSLFWLNFEPILHTHTHTHYIVPPGAAEHLISDNKSSKTHMKFIHRQIMIIIIIIGPDEKIEMNETAETVIFNQSWFSDLPVIIDVYGYRLVNVYLKIVWLWICTDSCEWVPVWSLSFSSFFFFQLTLLLPPSIYIAPCEWISVWEREGERERAKWSDYSTRVATSNGNFLKQTTIDTEEMQSKCTTLHLISIKWFACAWSPSHRLSRRAILNWKIYELFAVTMLVIDVEEKKKEDDPNIN